MTDYPGGFQADGRDDLFRVQYGLRLPIGEVERYSAIEFRTPLVALFVL